MVLWTLNRQAIIFSRKVKFSLVRLSLIKACARYFSLFLKDRCISSLVQTKYVEKKFTLQLFFLPIVSRTFILSWATRLLETSCSEKITVCVIQTTLVTLPLVQMNKARREVNRTSQVQTKINIVKGLQTSVIHLIPGSTCHWISNCMRYLLVKHFPATTNCKSRHLWVLLVKPVLDIS